MDYILISFNCNEVNDDLKIPTFIKTGELITMLNEIYQQNAKMLHFDPKGIILDTNKTLIEQGVGHGAKLTLR